MVTWVLLTVWNHSLDCYFCTGQGNKTLFMLHKVTVIIFVKLNMEMENVSKRQQPDQRADNN